MAVSGQPLNDRDRERIRKLTEQGMSVRKVANVVAVNPSTVQRILQKSR